MLRTGVGMPRGTYGEAFLDWLEGEPEHAEIDGDPVSVEWLFGQLWNCTDILPGYVRWGIECDYGPNMGTYAAAVRLLAQERRAIVSGG